MLEKALEALPRPLRRLGKQELPSCTSLFLKNNLLGLLEALAGSDSDIDVVSHHHRPSVVRKPAQFFNKGVRSY